MNQLPAITAGFTKKGAAICACVVIFVSIQVLVGWLLDIHVIKNLFPYYVSMKANTAFCFLLTGISLLLLSRERKNLLPISLALSTISALLAAVVIAQYLFNFDSGIDQLLVTDSFEEGYFSPGRMAFASALCLLLTGIGAWLLRSGSRYLKAAQLLFVLVFLTAYAILLSYLFGLRGYIGGENYTQMALRSAISFIVLSTGFLMLNPKKGFLELISNDYKAGYLLKQIVLYILLLPVVAGTLIVWGLRLQGYSMEVALALFALVYMILMLMITVSNFHKLRNQELYRKQQDRELQTLNKALTKNVEKLKASEQELQVSNEELTALNEELHALNDQLQAAREEAERLSVEKLQESSYRYKELADSISDPVLMVDSDYRYLYVNQAAAQIAGKKAEEMLDKTPIEVFGDKDKVQILQRKEVIKRVLATGKKETITNTVNLGPVAKTLEIMLYPTVAGHVLVITADISERIKAQQQLHEQQKAIEASEERYRRLFESNHDPLFLIDQETLQILDANNAACQVYGYSKEELLQLKKPVLSAEPDKTKALTFDQHDHIGQRLHRKKDGSIFPVEVSISFTQQGEKQLIIAATRDITERVQFTTQLEEEKLRLELALRTAKLGLYDWQVKANQSVWNDRYWQLLGVDPGTSSISNYKLWEISLHPEDKERVMQELVEHLEGKTPIYQSEYRIKHQDGEWLWVIDSGKVISKNEKGEPLRMIGTVLDITSRKNTEQAIMELNATLEQKVEERTVQLIALNKELEAFSYSVSHDLRAPLRSIDGFSKVLMTEYEPVLGAEGKEYLDTIRMATQRMGHLIDDLLKLSKVSRGQLIPAVVNVSQMACQILRGLVRESPQRKVKYEVMPDLCAMADMQLLQIALQNLLNNAWKYTSKKEEAIIEIGKCLTAKGEAFYVKDNGAGFDMRYADKLFGAFQRMHTNREFEGTGIGLAIVHRVVAKHGGEIWAEASPQQGATFFFILPELVNTNDEEV